MLRFVAGWVCVAWALWFGGLAALGMFAMRLFADDHPLAVQAAPHLFMAFEKYQLVVGLAAVVGAFVWRMGCKTTSAGTLFLLLAAAALAAGLGPRLLVDPMLQMWREGRSGTPEFMQLHGRSMLLFLAEELVLLAAGLLLPWALVRPAPAA